MGLLTRVKQWFWDRPAGSIFALPGVEAGRLTGELYDQPLVDIALRWYANNFPEPELIAQQWTDAGWVEQTSGAAARAVTLINRPNSYYTRSDLWSATLLSWFVDGNAYWYIARSASGQPLELWYLPHTQVTVVAGKTTQDYISHYEYRQSGSVLRLQRDEIVHFRNGMNPAAPQCGLSPLRTLLRELLTDQEASTYTAAVLQNMGIPGALISPADPQAIIPAEQAELIKTTYQQRITGRERGSAVVFPTGVRVDYPDVNPERMLLARLREVPESRIAAAFNLPPVILGFLTGLQYTATYNNMTEARDAAYESGILPLQRRFAETLALQFRLRENERLYWDNSEVRALQDDVEKTARWLNIGVAGGWIKLSEARARMGLETDASEDVYLRASNIVEYPIL